MDSEKINIKLLKAIIFEIATNNAATVSDIIINTKLKSEEVNEQMSFLKNLGLLDTEPSGNKFKQNIETLQKVANVLDNTELSRLMTTKYYQDNLKNYCTSLLNLLNENRLYPLPEEEYIEYALKNSPSTVRFFLVDNDINSLRSFYQKSISLTNEKVKDKNKIELFERSNMYFVWDNALFGKIQEDKQKGILLDPISYFAGYLPLAKKSFEKLLELYGMMDKVEKEETDNTHSNSKLKDYLKSLLPG